MYPVKLQNLNLKYGKSALMLTFLFVYQNVFASNEIVKQVKLSQCHQDFCITMTAPKLLKPDFGSLYAFPAADIQVTAPNKLIKDQFQGYEGYFESDRGRFFISKKGEKYEYLIDTKDRKVYRFAAN